MNVGKHKGKILAGIMAEQKPSTMVELGGYCGYSAILFGDALRQAGGRRYLSLEMNPEFAAVATMLIDLAGLRDMVEVIVGPCDKSLRKLHASGEVNRIDLLFLDHWKPAYVTDLKVCEELGLISPGCILAADNVIDPGNPPYLQYVRSSVAEKKSDAREKSSSNNGVGNPNLIYESKLIESIEPTGGRVWSLILLVFYPSLCHDHLANPLLCRTELS